LRVPEVRYTGASGGQRVRKSVGVGGWSSLRLCASGPSRAHLPVVLVESQGLCCQTCKPCLEIRPYLLVILKSLIHLQSTTNAHCVQRITLVLSLPQETGSWGGGGWGGVVLFCKILLHPGPLGLSPTKMPDGCTRILPPSHPLPGPLSGLAEDLTSQLISKSLKL